MRERSPGEFTENIFSGIWLSPYTTVLLWLASALAACWVWIKPPSPGISIAILGAVAAIMSIREMKHTQRAAWTLVVFALLAAEIHSINADRQQHDKEQIEERKRLDSDFAKVLDQNQKAFDATLSRLQSVASDVKTTTDTAKGTLSSVTGGDSYCYFMAVPNVWSGNPRRYKIDAYVVGKYPMPHLTASADVYVKSATEGGGVQLIVDSVLQPGPSLLPGHPTLPIGNHRIQMSTLNYGTVEEHLNMTLDEHGELKQTIELFGDGRILYSGDGSAPKPKRSSR